MDEFQSLFGNRNSSLSSQLIGLMDTEYDIRKQQSILRKSTTQEYPSSINDGSSGVNGAGSGVVGGGQVIVIAATNLPQNVDSSFLRQGRFDHVIYCPPPTETDRRKVLLHHAEVLPWYNHHHHKGEEQPQKKSNYSGTNMTNGRERGDSVLNDKIDEASQHMMNSKEGRGGEFSYESLAEPIDASSAMNQDQDNIDSLVDKTVGFSIADLGHLSRCALYHAKLRVIERLTPPTISSTPLLPVNVSTTDDSTVSASLETSTITSSSSSSGFSSPTSQIGKAVAVVKQCDYDNAFREVRPSITALELMKFETWKPSN